MTYGGNEVKLEDVSGHARGRRRRADARRGRGAGRAATRAPRCSPCSGCRTRAATSRSSCATCPRTCATCSWSRRSARCRTRSRSRPSTPTAWPPRPSASSQGEVLRAIDLLAAAISAVKDGSEPRIQLELALLKATQPPADLSLQALMFRIEQLERAARPARGPRTRRCRAQPAAQAAGAPTAPRPPPRGAAPAATAAGGGRGRAPSPRPSSRRAGRRRSTSSGSRPSGPRWPTPCARRTRWSARARRGAPGRTRAGDRLMVAFPADARFLKKKAEANRELVAARPARPHRAGGSNVAYELARTPLGPARRCSARKS